MINDIEWLLIFYFSIGKDVFQEQETNALSGQSLIDSYAKAYKAGGDGLLCEDCGVSHKFRVI